MTNREPLPPAPANMPETGTFWRHLKSGDECLVLGRVRLEATGRMAVHYRHNGETWARDADEFLDGRFMEITDD